MSARTNGQPGFSTRRYHAEDGDLPEMYAMLWFSLMEEYLGIPCTLHVTNMAISIASHTSDEKIGTAQ
jgi:hypothetical protein